MTCSHRRSAAAQAARACWRASRLFSRVVKCWKRAASTVLLGRAAQTARRAVVKHAGRCPRDNTSDGYRGKSSISGRGRPALRGDRNRNDRLARLRALLPATNAIVGIDLADRKQAAVVTDHDSRVLAQRRLTCRAWELGELLDWALGQARAAGFTSVTIACEPTGHRWRVLDQLAADRGLGLVCVQPLLVWRAREAEDLRRTFLRPCPMPSRSY